MNRARLEKDVEHLGRRKTDREGDLNEATGDLTGAQGELDAALAYYEKLKPSCVDAGVTYEDRVGRRTPGVRDRAWDFVTRHSAETKKDQS